MNRRNCIVTMAICCLIVLVASGAVIAAGKSNGYGLLTSVEDDGTVIINDDNGQSSGYLLSPSVSVQNSRQESITLRSLLPASHIYFEYEYTRAGFMITLIREIPR